MNDDPIQLLFGGLEKLGPGDDATTLHVLRTLPKRDFRLVVDAGAGAGRQTLVLANELGFVIHAVDTHESFLDDLRRRADKAKLGHLVQTHCMDMKDIPSAFQNIGLLWSEGAAYNIGFANALRLWHSAIAPGRFAVVSELCWLKEQVPDVASEFFRSAYPDMQPIAHNMRVAEDAGYKLLSTHTVPRESWVAGYYDVLAPRAKALLEHASEPVREFAAETVREIEVFERSEGSYGYVFFVLQREAGG
jgi:SAM-dependent methyltransferase